MGGVGLRVLAIPAHTTPPKVMRVESESTIFADFSEKRTSSTPNRLAIIPTSPTAATSKARMVAASYQGIAVNCLTGSFTSLMSMPRWLWK